MMKQIEVYQLLDGDFKTTYDFSALKKQLQQTVEDIEIKIYGFEDNSTGDILQWVDHNNKHLEERIAESEKIIENSSFLKYRGADKQDTSLDGKLGYYFTKYGFLGSLGLSAMVGFVEYAYTHDPHHAAEWGMYGVMLINGATQAALEFTRNLGKLFERSEQKVMERKKEVREEITTIIQKVSVHHVFDENAANIVEKTRFVAKELRESNNYLSAYDVNDTLMRYYKG